MKIEKKTPPLMDEYEYLEITGTKEEMDYAQSLIRQIRQADVRRHNSVTLIVGPLDKPRKVWGAVYKALNEPYPWWKRIF